MKAAIQASVLQTSSTVSVAAGATIEVRLPSGTLATLYTTREGTTTTANPIIADGTGFFRAYAEAGRYTLTITAGAAVKTYQDVIILSDVITEAAPGCPGYLWTRTSDNTISSVLTTDMTSLFFVNRRLKINDAGVTKYGIISISAFTTTTDLTITMEDGATIDNNPAEVCLVSSTTTWVPIAADPFSGTEITLLASGQVGANYVVMAAGLGGRISYSTNGGVDWTASTTGTAEDIQQIEYDPTTQSFVFACSSQPWKASADGGLTWTQFGSHTIGSTSSGRFHISGGSVYRWAGSGYHNVWSIANPANVAFTYGIRDSTMLTSTSDDGYFKNAENSYFLRFTISGSSQLVSYRATFNAGPLTSTNTVETIDTGSTIHQITQRPTISKLMAVSGGQLFRTTTVADPQANQWVEITSHTFGMDDIRGAAFGENGITPTWVIVGDNGKIEYSLDDGLTFTAVLNGFGTLESIVSVVYHEDPINGSVFIAGSSNGTISRSSNGII